MLGGLCYSIRHGWRRPVNGLGRAGGSGRQPKFTRRTQIQYCGVIAEGKKAAGDGRAPSAAWKNCHAHKQADCDGGLQRFCRPGILETVISGNLRAVQLNTVEYLCNLIIWQNLFNGHPQAN